MSTRKHKRRRLDTDDQLLFDDTEASIRKQMPESTANKPEPSQVEQEQPPPGVEGDAEASAKEREVWDAFREEHYELLEQLPLSLHRAFTLIHELDQQAQENIIHIAPAVLKYVSLRKALAAATASATSAPNTHDTHLPNGVADEQMEGADETPATNGKTAKSVPSSVAATTPGPSTNRPTPTSTSKSLASAVQNSTSTRELLIHIAQSSEEVTRACAEKVYLAQHAYDLVDRYIRDLDRAIKEQEASISLGLRPGTHPASIILPEVVPPQSSRGRVVASPPPISIASSVPAPALAPHSARAPEVEVIEVLDEPEPEPAIEEAPDVPMAEEPAAEGSIPGPQATGEEVSEEPTAPEELDEAAAPDAPWESGAPAATAAPREKKKGKKRKKSSTNRRRTTHAAPEAAADTVLQPTEDVVVPQEEPQAPLTLRIPAQAIPQAPVAILDDMPPDPNEPRYCFCNQVSFGDMIACDNPTCTREWFHIGCVGLTKIPKGNWYCRECAALRKRSKSRRRR
ncbi:hypothetical protein C8Q77DRAFT_1155131 [Trametes polyzona]|nr:hypothetical protein C8Q77DRAFT_1155131 [Trametes polyzona]